MRGSTTFQRLCCADMQKVRPRLREREMDLKRDQMEGIDSYVAGHATVNEVFDRLMAVKTNLRRTTRANYELMYNRHVRNGFGERPIGSIKY